MSVVKGPINSILELLTHRRLHGSIQSIISGYFVIHFAHLWYNYHFTDILYYGMYPDWAMMVFMLLGILGILTGVRVFIGELRLGISYVLQLCYLLAGVVLHILSFG